MDTNSRNFTFDYQGQTWKIKRSRHLYEERLNGYTRDEYINKTRYIEIFKEALRHGLTSFRRNNQVVVTIPDYTGRWYSILCNIHEDSNTIDIITVYKARYDWWKTFRTVRHRINIMYGYVVPKFTKKEIQQKEFDKIVNDIEINRDDVDFKYAMDSLNDYEFRMEMM
jgi:hypothetical protein